MSHRAPPTPVLRATLGLVAAALLAAPAALRAQSPDLAALDRYIARAQRDWPVPGLAVAIVQDGEVVLEKGYGVRELGGSEPVDAHTLFAIASNTKAFVAASMAMLVDEGKVGWEDPVRDHLPYFRLHDPLATELARVDDLLTHRSGLGTYSGDLLWYGTPYTAREVVERTRHLPPTTSFRSAYGYSNLMFIAAGEVISTVSGMPFTDFVRTRIFQPLGMERTTFDDAALPRLGNVATPHRERDGDLVPLEWFAWTAADAAGGIVSSVHDMALWLRLQLGRGSVDGVTLFSPERSHEMWSAETPMSVSRARLERFPSTHFRAYGLGWSLSDYRGRKLVEHGGGYDGMFSRVALVPEEDLAIVVLTNSMTSVTDAIKLRVLDAYLGGPERNWSAEMLPAYRRAREGFRARQRAVLDFEGPAGEPRPLGTYAAAYGSRLYGDAEVRERGGGLVLTLLPNPDLVADLTHLHHDTFRLEWRKDFAWFDGGVVQFLTTPDGRVSGMFIDVPNEDLWFHELDFRRKGAADGG